MVKTLASDSSASIKVKMLNGELFSFKSIKTFISYHFAIRYVDNFNLGAFNICNSLHNFIIYRILAVTCLDGSYSLRARLQEL